MSEKPKAVKRFNYDYISVIFLCGTAVVRGSKQLQENDAFCMADGTVMRIRMCEGVPS